ncbi:N-succinylarginine dihydrolase [Robiginitomaculum antarcticum]|uniref:N-succinylarginine dihydrolase n=1 Tax=Robiginitomaculum antarcticum TaxID=437507 RepID=UPI000365F393|nr:N-succinylarginine dihydrolase [Robiginitomaculum antarcticum]
MGAREANFDGLIGPTHNYGGLSQGNLASSRHAGLISSPRGAALQGLEKMAAMHAAGLWQGILPPQQRPYLPALHQMGFTGSDAQIFAAAWEKAPRLMRNLMSASSMWAANAATISPSADCADGKLHFTPANLSTMLHRSIEHEQTGRSLSRAFPFAAVHRALPEQSVFADEGAANHVRLCGARGDQGVELLVYGRDGYDSARAGYPARQTVQASRAIARSHGLDPARTVFALQSDAAIDAGAFHNDVVCVGAMQTLFYHELAFADTEVMKTDIRAAAKGVFEPIFVEVASAEVPMADAIKAYLFNSMLVQMPGEDRLTLIAPLETQENVATRQFCDVLTAGNGPIGTVKFVDVRQSMQNGGGPACLRLRVTLTEAEWADVHDGNRFTPALHRDLKAWVNTHYRESLAPDDIRDPAIMTESFAALDALTKIMDLGDDFYPFQRG